MKRLEVHKFGGTSLADAERMRSAAAMVAAAAARSASVVVVASAAGDATDVLTAAVDDAVAGDVEAAEERITSLISRHIEILQALDGSEETRAEIGYLWTEVIELLRGIGIVTEAAPRLRDRVVVAGEKLSVRLLASALRAAGLNGVPVEADTFLATDGEHGHARPIAGVTERSIAGALRSRLERGEVPVVTGFSGRSPQGATTTLGRGGSDFSATLIAAALDADEVTIWTDVHGVYTADPGIVPGARSVGQLNYREAAELSYYGAKVLHQRTIQPVAAKGIPVWVRKSGEPDGPSTVVDARLTPGSHPVKAISAVQDQALVSVEGKGMVGVPGVAERVFAALAHEGISVTMISQSSSEASICLAVSDDAAVEAEVALKRTFRADISTGAVEDITVRRHVALVAAVGLGMAQTPGVSGKLFSALGENEVNVLAIAQGSSELNISLAVEARDVEAAVRTIHERFGLHRRDTHVASERRLDLLLLGFGNIGRAVASLVNEQAAHIHDHLGLEPRVVAIADRRGCLIDPKGIDPAVIERAAAAKADGHSLAELDGAVPCEDPAEMVRQALTWRLARPILVDVSNHDEAKSLWIEAMHLGCDVVTANKTPLAGPLSGYREILDQSRESRRQLRAEATVGAGLPVLDTLQQLLVTGDRLERAEGCLSGTLAFVLGALQDGEPFSEAVAEAIRRGYTEPDPLIDLAGGDAARKAIILGRFSGLAEDEKSIALEGLVDPSLTGLAPDELVERLRSTDADMAARASAAAARGCVLRHVARVERGAMSVGPTEVPVDSPLGRLQGTDNMIVVHSERYRVRPLVVTGPGAGIDVTAMGVLSDVLRVAAEGRRT